MERTSGGSLLLISEEKISGGIADAGVCWGLWWFWVTELLGAADWFIPRGPRGWAEVEELPCSKNGIIISSLVCGQRLGGVVLTVMLWTVELPLGMSEPPWIDIGPPEYKRWRGCWTGCVEAPLKYRLAWLDSGASEALLPILVFSFLLAPVFGGGIGVSVFCGLTLLLSPTSDSVATLLASSVSCGPPFELSPTKNCPELQRLLFLGMFKVFELLPTWKLEEDMLDSGGGAFRACWRGTSVPAPILLFSPCWGRFSTGWTLGVSWRGAAALRRSLLEPCWRRFSSVSGNPSRSPSSFWLFSLASPTEPSPSTKRTSNY